jgi:RHS repeat-associated protein
VSGGIRAAGRLRIHQWYGRAAKAAIPDRVREHGFFVSAIKEKRQAFHIAMTPCGRRLWKEVDGTRTYFLYSDEGLIGEYDSTGTETKTYGWTPDSLWGTDPLFLKINGYYYFYQNDHQGTPQKLIGTNGLVVWSGIYDSFGNCQVEVEGITNNLRFAGQYYDEETGLHYNWYRYYDTQTGRYMRTDPFGVGLNLYDYCFNNSHNWIDPLGLCAVSTAWNKTKNLAAGSWNYFWYDLFFDISNFSAGFGDIISLGVTKNIRDLWNEALGWENAVNYGSINYSIGKYAGYAWFIGTGVAAIEAGALGTIRAGGVAAWMWAKPGLVTVSLLGTNAVLSRPIIAQNIADFVQGFVPGAAPPPSFAGFMGFEAGRLFERIMNRNR